VKGSAESLLSPDWKVCVGSSTACWRLSAFPLRERCTEGHKLGASAKLRILSARGRHEKALIAGLLLAYRAKNLAVAGMHCLRVPSKANILVVC
jgi:hypothetical protein